MSEGADGSAAERRLLDAVRAEQACDFADGADIASHEMAAWGSERTISATFLRQLIVGADRGGAPRLVRLRGAVIDGALNLRHMDVPGLQLTDCRVASLDASGATFTGDAAFNSATFTGDAAFSGATFTGDAWFSGATFAGHARFSRATFTGQTEFLGANFIGDAAFPDATFTGHAWFLGANFTGHAEFPRATFTGDTAFNGATFTGHAWFSRANFSSNAGFFGSTFTGDAAFNSATFTSHADFLDANFTGDANFLNASAPEYAFNGAQFHGPDPGPWIARRVDLSRAVFHVRSRVAVAAVEVDSRRLQAREGIHLLIRSREVDLSDAEFQRRSILAQLPTEPPLTDSEGPDGPAETAEVTRLDEDAREAAPGEAFEPAHDNLSRDLSALIPTRSRVVSLRRTVAGDLVLSGVDLDQCAFAGAHQLDKMRIDATCTFGKPPTWPRETLRPFTRRRVLYEEALWRQANTQGWPKNDASDTERAEAPPSALEIAGIYRDLRKGLEDAKDEPGAADFYYGEMEMRRLATETSAVERWLLGAYWAISGYGLRAWRALAALTVLWLACAGLFTLPVFARPPDPALQVSSVDVRTGQVHYAPVPVPGSTTGQLGAVHFATGLEFTARESLTLTRAAGDPILKTTGAGTALDLALRLLTPLLLGLAVLAIRGRTKR